VAGRTFERFTVNERVQHAVLFTTFTVLVVTGFALKFPESWWAQPLVRMEGGYAVRAWVHRAAGALMCLAGAYHLWHLLGTGSGRAHLRALAPRRHDLTDAVRVVLASLGRGGARPRFHRFSYVEKLEYWAVVWGTIVMGVTGFVMWFQTPVLARLPLWVIDLATVVHYYEAWLATLAIVVWHFYSVIFRADVYPMSWVWLSGRLTGAQMAEEHPAELDEILEAERAASPAAGPEADERA
jgi:cytochrome b subunit of formate dehydrogenase